MQVLASKYLLLFYAVNIFSTTATKNLSKNIDAILNTYPHIHVGCEITSLKNNKIIYSRNADHLFIPASNTKIFTTILALEYLGEDYVFDTELYIDGKIKNGSLYGDLYIKASGNPTLTSDGLEKIITFLPKVGIKRIMGNCYLDTNTFDAEYYPPGSFIDNIGYSWNIPISALIIDHKLCILKEELSSTSGECILIDALIESLLKKHSIKLHGIIDYKWVPENAQILLRHKSAELSKILKNMLKESDNLYADCVFKKIASIEYSSTATWSNASKILHSFLVDNINIPASELCIKDGSGRSRYNLVSPHHIVKVLTWAFNQPYYETFIECFPTNGIDGTMKERLANLQPCIKAKTGTLSGVSTLSGYIELPNETLAFSILINGYIAENIMNPPCKNEIENAICLEIMRAFNCIA